MLPWFFRDGKRLSAERSGIDELSRDVAWLVGHEWRMDGGLCLNAVIRAHAKDYEVRVEFPPLFPVAPIIVRPINATTRWSTHQYGDAGGPLCLEWGPDNWHPAVTARQMIESAHRLLEIENPLGDGDSTARAIAPSRHALTMGQALRGTTERWLVSSALGVFLGGEERGTAGSFNFSYRHLDGNTWVALVHSAVRARGELWSDTLIPTSMPGARVNDLCSGVWLKTQLHADAIRNVRTLDDLRNLAPGTNALTLLATDGSSPVEGFSRPLAAVLVVDGADVAHLLIIISSTSAVYSTPVELGDSAVNLRAPDQELLKKRRVGIVGVGSAGSKIAMSLSRMGVGEFYLVDHDVLLPGNLRRHALTWQGVTLHKADALAATLRQIDAQVRVNVSRVHLAGQESNAILNGVLRSLADCDLIVDATATGRTFNLIAAAASLAGKPLVWLEIFGGGVGGVIGRSRSRVDPSPQDMRQAYLQFSAYHPAPEGLRVAEGYEQTDAAGVVIGASDADVAIISHHAAKLAVDCFREATESKFPHSMYLIGLEAAWVFDAPFSVIPISTAFLPVSAPDDFDGEALGAENVAFLSGLHSGPSD